MKIATSNVNYKLAMEVHRMAQEFNKGDYIMVCIHPERFPKHSFKKLHARASGPFPII